jgi:hypothetical protein
MAFQMLGPSASKVRIRCGDGLPERDRILFQGVANPWKRHRRLLLPAGRTTASAELLLLS